MGRIPQRDDTSLVDCDVREKKNQKKLTAHHPVELQSSASLKKETPSDEEDSLESFFHVNDTSSVGHECDSESSEPKPSFKKSPEKEICFRTLDGKTHHANYVPKWNTFIGDIEP